MTQDNDNDNDNEVETDDELVALLSRAARPTTETTTEIRHQLAAMAQTIVDSRGVRPRRKLGLVSMIVAPFLLLGAAGAAYAATNIDWSQMWHNAPQWADWAQAPDATVTYSLPGGGTCEMRFGVVPDSPYPGGPAGVPADPRAEQTAREFLQTPNLLTLVDVAGTITSMRVKDKNWAQAGDGTEVPFGYGTDNYSADVEYNMAVKQAIQVGMEEHFESLGIPESGFGYQSQEQCTGATQ
ncbi:hypothetical protein [Cryobacterium zhongshanensis]|uniref:Uncharacterized protein n=1 Tax=Cryobacterium zhongshanensis TaxID=2928153 RepID=A0AA41UGS1_9MICO|nr:hypothetical protein [Cryobacterium zhongshanensis]MCI4659482.1 hypothetical protein [Cryobacterium zhongshanensis]